MTTISLQPAALDLKLYAGDGFALQFQFVDKATGLPWPATGVWEAQVRSPAASATIVLSFAVDVTSAAEGKITISLSGDQTRALLPFRDAVWDLQQDTNTGEPRTWYRGKLAITQDVTRTEGEG
jgi:hypothetical protein